MADCAKCGAKLKEDARFCGACGSKVNDKQEKEGAQGGTGNTQKEPGSTRKKKKLIAILTGVCSMAVVLALLLRLELYMARGHSPKNSGRQ